MNLVHKGDRASNRLDLVLNQWKVAERKFRTLVIRLNDEISNVKILHFEGSAVVFKYCLYLLPGVLVLGQLVRHLDPIENFAQIANILFEQDFKWHFTVSVLVRIDDQTLNTERTKVDQRRIR